MKSLSSFNETAIDNPYTNPILLLKIEFTGLTLYLCDRVFGTAPDECVFNGQIYEPLIISWDTVRCGKINFFDGSTQPGEFSVVIDNNTPVGGATRFTNLFEKYGAQYVTVTASLIFEGADVITNSCLYSTQFDNAAWAKQASVTITADDAVAPDGNTAADKYNISASVNRAIYQDITGNPASKLYTFSLYVKATSATQIYVNFRRDAVNLAGGETWIIPGDSTWHRYTMTYTYDATAGASYGIVFFDSSGNTGDRFHLWGAQLEVNKSSPGYFVETTSAAASQSDEIVIFKGEIEEPRNMLADQITLVVSDYALSISNKFDHAVVDETTYPGADPDDIGKMLPQCYGRCNKVPFMAVDAGAITTLAADATKTDTTITLTDSSHFPSSGTIQIDSEQITYTGNASNQLTGCTRGVNSTTAAVHNMGASVAEIKTNYFYIIGHAVNSIDAVYVDNVRQTSGFTAYTGQTGDEHASYPGKACIVFNTLPILKRQVNLEAELTDYNIALEATNVPIGYAESIDRNGYLVGYDDSTTITFQSAPAGTLSDIYVEYDFEFYQFGAPTLGGEKVFELDGVVIAKYDEHASPQLTQYVSSPLVVPKTSWPSSATKTASWVSRVGKDLHGIMFVVTSAKVYCTSTVDDTDQRGKLTTRKATNLPVGRFITETEYDDGTTITFPAAPSGTLSDIAINVSWTRHVMGGPQPPETLRNWQIDGKTVAATYRKPDNTYGYTTLRGSSITILKNSWQTSIPKTASYLNTLSKVGNTVNHHGEAFIITSATQSCYTDVYDAGITLTGNSVADTVIGGRVSADVKGFQDDASGTYTGTPNALIEQPDHICKHIIMHRCGLSSSEIDSSSYTTSGTAYTTNSFRLGVVILQKPDVKAQLNRIARQSKSIEFWEAGAHHLVYIPAITTPDKTFEGSRIDLNQMWIQYTNRVDLKNILSARYSREWSGYSTDIESDRNLVTARVSGSIAKYGSLQGEQITFPYIIDQAQAQAILDWLCDNQAFPQLLVEFAGGYYLTDIERGDVIKFDLGYDEGLVGYWPFNEGSGTTAKDISDYGNHGTLYGSMTDDDWVQGVTGTALDFDGVDDYVQISDD